MTHTSARRAFTLVELLVVIGIAALLMGILLPTILGALRSAERSRTKADLQAISGALEAYKQEFGDYPRALPGDPNDTGVANGFAIAEPYVNATNPGAPGRRGARILAWALLGTGTFGDLNTNGSLDANEPIPDGFNGAGFRARPAAIGGKVSGPYIATDRFKIRYGPNSNRSPFAGLDTELLDRDGNPILYIPADPVKRKLTDTLVNNAVAVPYIGVPNTTAANANARFFPRYDSSLNSGCPANDGSRLSAVVLSVLLGDFNANGVSEPNLGEAAAIDLPFLLFAAGPDGKFGYDGMAENAAAENAKILSRRVDDVTNFRE